MPDLKFSVYALVEEFLGLQETQLQQEKKLQVNLCQKLFFLENMGRTEIVLNVCFVLFLTEQA